MKKNKKKILTIDKIQNILETISNYLAACIVLLLIIVIFNIFYT